MVEIVWLGHSCFRIKGKEAVVLTDPYDKDLGYDLGRPKVDIVTVSHNHANHSSVHFVKGEPKIIDGPGEYEISDVFITGIRTYHDDDKGKLRGTNTVYLLELEDLVICHLGDLGHLLTEEQVDAMSNVDVLLIPVGGRETIDASQASEVISQVEPRVVVPMHYQTDVLTRGLEGVGRFCKEMGLKECPPQEKLSLRAADLPEQMQVVVLDHKN
ncbi:MAG: MBL fold metallo-hydrolase [Chloroflexi bacterium]|nr:MBL fold metallo-hydrolase [Chloroflexota bacterium]